MPVYEFYCERCQRIEERFFHRWQEQAPPCPLCSNPRVLLASRFAVVFTGPITARYNLKDREGAEQEGVWMYRKKTSLSGEPEPVYIETFSELKEFCRQEGIYGPGEVPINATISPDGRKISSAGMPGQWASFSPEVLPERTTAPPPDPDSAKPLVEVHDRRFDDPRNRPTIIPLPEDKQQEVLETGSVPEEVVVP